MRALHYALLAQPQPYSIQTFVVAWLAAVKRMLCLQKEQLERRALRCPAAPEAAGKRKASHLLAPVPTKRPFSVLHRL